MAKRFGFQIGFGGGEPGGEPPAGPTPGEGEPPPGDSPSEETPPTEESPADATSWGDAPAEPPPIEEASASFGETPSEEPSSGETPAGEPSFGEAPSEEPSFGEAPAEESSFAEAPPAEEPSFGEPSATEEPAAEVPPAEEAPPEAAESATPAAEAPPSGAGLSLSTSGRGIEMAMALEAGAPPPPGTRRRYIKWVSPGILLRGGAPDQRVFEDVKAQGVTTVFNLGKADAKWRATVEGLGMRAIALTSLGEPCLTDDEVEAFLGIARKSKNWPIFVHCDDGAERTGALCAVFRIAVEGMDANAAIAEAKQMGLRSKEQEDFIRRFYEEFKAGNLG